MKNYADRPVYPSLPREAIGGLPLKLDMHLQLQHARCEDLESRLQKPEVWGLGCGSWGRALNQEEEDVG